MIDDAGIEALRGKHGAIGTVDFNGHRIVFCRPTRDQARDYRRKEDSPTEKPDRVDQLAQQTIIAFDDVTDRDGARAAFLAFLAEYPLFCDSPKAQTVLTVLAGAMEAEHATLLGKGCKIVNGTRKP